MAINRWVGQGNLVFDVEVKQAGEKKVLNNKLAINWGKSADGKSLTDFIPFTAWDKDAELIGRLSKGSQVALEGNIKVESYKDKNDTMQTKVFVRVTSVGLCYGTASVTQEME